AGAVVLHLAVQLEVRGRLLARQDQSRQVGRRRPCGDRRRVIVGGHGIARRQVQADLGAGRQRAGGGVVDRRGGVGRDGAGQRLEGRQGLPGAGALLLLELDLAAVVVGAGAVVLHTAVQLEAGGRLLTRQDLGG